jgi:type IV pilus assembly protein PilW
MPSTRPAAARGFTLVELMVGLALSMLTVLIITQVLAISQARMRTIGAGNDAQINGALAAFTLQRDIQQAGYGLAVTLDALGCPVQAKYASMPTIGFKLAPVVIAPGATGADPDTITVLRSNTASASLPMPLTANHLQTDASFTVASALGTSAGDMIVAVPDSMVWETDPGNWWCAMLSATSSASNPITSSSVPHGAGGWNQAAAMPAGTLRGSSLASQPRGYLLNLGSLVLRTYSVGSDGNLQTADFSSSSGAMDAPRSIYSQVVNLKALYGKDTDGDGAVDIYDNVTPTTNVGWRQVLAIKIAVVTRSTHFEKESVSKADPLWDVGTTATIAGPATQACNGGSKCIAIPVSQLPDWAHYRYTIYSKTVPLRNVLWNS